MEKNIPWREKASFFGVGEMSAAWHGFSVSIVGAENEACAFIGVASCLNIGTNGVVGK